MESEEFLRVVGEFWVATATGVAAAGGEEVEGADDDAELACGDGRVEECGGFAEGEPYVGRCGHRDRLAVRHSG